MEGSARRSAGEKREEKEVADQMELASGCGALGCEKNLANSCQRAVDCANRLYTIVMYSGSGSVRGVAVLPGRRESGVYLTIYREFVWN